MSKRKYRRPAGQSPCHNGVSEVVPGILCGAEDEFVDALRAGLSVDVLVPLNTLSGRVWDTGFRGEILYYPIPDFGVLPDDILQIAIQKILDRKTADKKVGIFCMGGHGRTGYLTAIVLGKLGHDDPIGFLRKHYCNNAVESIAQIKHIAEVLGKPELIKEYAMQPVAADFFYDINYPLWFQSPLATLSLTDEQCSDCVYFSSSYCVLLDANISGCHEACWDFESCDPR